MFLSLTSRATTICVTIAVPGATVTLPLFDVGELDVPVLQIF